jgi:hypothetical protein
MRGQKLALPEADESTGAPGASSLQPPPIVQSSSGNDTLMSILQLTRPDFLRFRKLSIAAILATDMVRAQ